MVMAKGDGQDRFSRWRLFSRFLKRERINNQTFISFLKLTLTLAGRVKNITYVDKHIVPKVKTTRKSTRSGDKIDGALVLEEQLCRTCTYAVHAPTLDRTWSDQNEFGIHYQQKCAGTSLL